MRQELKAWYNQFAENAGRLGFKHNSLAFKKETDDNRRVYTKLGMRLAETLVVKMLDLKPEALDELHKVDKYSFDIFKLREHTNGNELTTLLPYVLAKHGLIGGC